MRIAIIAIVTALTFFQAQAAAPRRELTPSDVAKIGALLFPEHCGSRGNRCGYGYMSSGDRRSVCPFELWISMPDNARIVGFPKTMWVGLDERKRPIAMASHKTFGDNVCADREQAS